MSNGIEIKDSSFAIDKKKLSLEMIASDEKICTLVKQQGIEEVFKLDSIDKAIQILAERNGFAINDDLSNHPDSDLLFYENEEWEASWRFTDFVEALTPFISEGYIEYSNFDEDFRYEFSDGVAKVFVGSIIWHEEKEDESEENSDELSKNFTLATEHFPEAYELLGDAFLEQMRSYLEEIRL